jgi:hypothetical protein
VSFDLSERPLSEPERAGVARAKRIAGFVPLAWCVVAVVVQLVIVAVMIPRLPESVVFYVTGGINSGPGHYIVPIGGLVETTWVVIAVCAAASIVLALRASVRKQSVPWSEASMALLAGIVPAGLFIVLGTLLPQLGSTSPSEPQPIFGTVDAFAWGGLVVGLVLGLFSILWLPKKLARLRLESTR